MDSSASAKVDIAVNPAQSQVLLVAVTVVVAICVLLAGALFFAQLVIGASAMLGFGALLSIGTLFAWNKSQPATDFPSASPTTFQLPDGTQAATDSRLLAQPETAASFLRLIEGLTHRQALPPPAGLVDDAAQIIPGSDTQANAVVAKINAETDAATLDAVARLRLQDRGLQQVDHMAPLAAAANREAAVPIGTGNVP